MAGVFLSIPGGSRGAPRCTGSLTFAIYIYKRNIPIVIGGLLSRIKGVPLNRFFGFATVNVCRVKPDIHTCVHAFVYAYIYTYIHSYMHAYIHTDIHIYTYSYIHTRIHTYIHTYIRT